jgi:hypothetical protein
MLAWGGTFEETNETLATELDIANNQCCSSLQTELDKAKKLDKEVTEELWQEWSCDHAS